MLQMQPSRMGGLFGNNFPRHRSPYESAGIGDGMEQPHAYAQAEEPKKPGFFAQGGVGRNIAGHIGDALLQLNRMQPIYAEAMGQQRAMQQRQQLAMQARQAGLEDYEAKKKIDLRYPSATGEEYTYFEDNAGNRWRQNKSTGAVDPNPTFIDKTPKEFVHEGMRFSIANPYLGGGGASGDMPTVSDAASYEALAPGAQYRDPQGNVRTKQGGPTPQASGTFQSAFGRGI